MGEKTMDQTWPYSSSLTAEQFLFYEMRIAAKLYLEGEPVLRAIDIVRGDNLFQYPTERKVAYLTRACYRRLNALGNEQLVYELAFAHTEIAKQINLYAMMRSNRLVWEFMIQVIGEKYCNQDFYFSKKDLNAFFARMQAQNDSIAAWSETTIGKIKSVLVRALIETEYLDGHRDTTLYPIFLCEELERGIRENRDDCALPAFNCLR